MEPDEQPQTAGEVIVRIVMNLSTALLVFLVLAAAAFLLGGLAGIVVEGYQFARGLG